jgi:hypothetical protein
MRFIRSYGSGRTRNGDLSSVKEWKDNGSIRFASYSSPHIAPPVSRFKQKRSEEQQEKAERRLLSRQEEKKRKLADMGIDYDMSAVEYVRF